MYLLNRRPTKEDRMAALMALLAVVVSLGAVTLQKPLVIRAQNALCSQILPEVYKRLQACSRMDRDQVCYGNPSVSATFVDAAGPVTFTKTGDIVDLSALKTLQTTPYNKERNEWGIAALKVQVNNLDGTTTGQAATFVLFGDTQLTNATAPSSQPTVNYAPPPACSVSTTRLSNLRNAPVNGSPSVKVLGTGTSLNISGRLADNSWLFADLPGQTGWVLGSSVKPGCDLNTEPVIDPTLPTVLTGLRAFYFTTGVSSQAQCRDIPEGGFMVRSPTGRKVEFSVDGTDIKMGSTVQFMKAGNRLIILVLDGEITVTLNGQSVTVAKGQQLTINITGDPPQAVGPLPKPEPVQNPASPAVRCAVDPVIAYGCLPQVPGNLSVVVSDQGDPILRPNGGEGVVNGPPPVPRAPQSQPQPQPTLVCLNRGAVCVANSQCCSGICNPGFCTFFPCPSLCA